MTRAWITGHFEIWYLDFGLCEVQKLFDTSVLASEALIKRGYHANMSIYEFWSFLESVFLFVAWRYAPQALCVIYERRFFVLKRYAFTLHFRPKVEEVWSHLEDLEKFVCDTYPFEPPVWIFRVNFRKIALPREGSRDQANGGVLCSIPSNPMYCTKIIRGFQCIQLQGVQGLPRHCHTARLVDARNQWHYFLHPRPKEFGFQIWVQCKTSNFSASPYQYRRTMLFIFRQSTWESFIYFIVVKVNTAKL